MAVFPWCSVLCPQPRFLSFLIMSFLFRGQDMLSPKLSDYQPKSPEKDFSLCLQGLSPSHPRSPTSGPGLASFQLIHEITFEWIRRNHVS